MKPTPELAVVVSTIGRQSEFRRLMQSVNDSPEAHRIELVVVDQSADGVCAQVAAEREWEMSVRTATSARGAAVGRNVGLALTAAPIVGFPDDDAWYPVGALGEIVAAFAAAPTLAGLCGRQVTSEGQPSMLRWQSEPGPVTSRNFLHTSIMSTMFFRRSWLDRIGPFDENMGVGSASWYGACEESDLLLRVIQAGGEVNYDPSLLVLQEDPRDEIDHRFVAKMLSYGCGQGHLWRKHDLPRGQLAYYCARKLVAAGVRAVRGERVLAQADLAWLYGNVSGLRDVPPKALRNTKPAMNEGAAASRR